MRHPSVSTRLIDESARHGVLESDTDMDYFYMDIPGPGPRQVHVTFHSHMLGRNAEISFRAPGGTIGPAPAAYAPSSSGR